jgi:hypothetical protein
MPAMKRQDRRHVLAAAVREELFPLVTELGFENIRAHPELQENYSRAAAWTFVRIGGDRVNELDFQWDRWGRPWFIINFETRPHPCEFDLIDASSRVYPSMNTLFRMLLRGEPAWFGEGRHRLDGVIADATQGVLDLDVYFRTGKSTRRVHTPRREHPGLSG